MSRNKYAIGTVIGAALLGLTKSSRLGSKNDVVIVSSVDELIRHANDRMLACRVWAVVLAGEQLTSIPPEIFKLMNLEMLNLTGNQLTTIPPEIGKLTKLEWLALRGNELTTLPPEIGNLTNLKQLDLMQNKLRTLPPEIWNLTSLKELYLGGNQLTTLPPEIGNLKNLETLYLTANQLTTLPAEIGNLTNLEMLLLYRNPNLKITLDFVIDVLNTYQNTDVATILSEYIHQQTIPARQTIRMR